ncbi:MAG: oligopeptide ABC transporter substrate-binding protein [Treponema sp.]
MKVCSKIACAVCLTAAALLVFISCGGKSGSAGTAAAEAEKKKFEIPFPQMIQRGEPAVKGTVVFGFVTDTPWKGEFNTFLYQDNPTFEVMLPMLGLFMRGGLNHEIIDGGLCNVSFDREAKTATYHIDPALTWSDGVPVTADDIIFVYESVCHPDYDGVRYDTDYENVIGAVEYHEGKAESISGLTRVDDKTVTVAFKEFKPSILWGAGLTYNPEPAHYLKDIPLKEMRLHDRVRKNPLACGPFVINSMVEGDIIEYVPNPYWCRTKTTVEKLIVKRIAPTSCVEAVKSGEVDVIELKPDMYDQFVELDSDGRPVKDKDGKIKMKIDNIDLTTAIDRAYGYVAFKMGKWNPEKEECETFADGGKFKDKALRQAIAYAMDNDGINEIYYHGLRITPNSLITPAHPGFYDENLEGYSYNPEKAKQLLDEAGYKDVDGDGFRETPDGKPLTINYLSMTGSDVAEPIANYHIQNWKDVGLNVGLNDGRLVEFNAFYQKLQKDDPAVEIYAGAWGVGSDPDPNGLYSKKAQFNLPRWVNEKNDAFLNDIASEQAIDETFRAQAYKNWNENIMDEAVVIPINYRLRLRAINKRVKSWDYDSPGTDWDWNMLGLISDTPAVNSMK